MAVKSDPNERFEGIDRSVLDDDVWAETLSAAVCPTCGLQLAGDEIRCRRCNALVLTGCGGSCASCGSRTCVRREERG